MNDLFEWSLAVARQTAYRYGYAIGLHGSGTRDLDLIAVPWTEKAVDAKTLAEFIRIALNVEFGDIYFVGKPRRKPWGRIAYTIRLTPNLFIDLSVAPRII